MKLRQLATFAGIAALSLAIFAPAANADVHVNAGSLAFDPAGAPTIGDFDAVTLNGTPQLTSLTVAPFTIIDSRGTAAGWHVELTVPDFVNGTSTIAASNVSMSAPVVVPAAGSDITGVAGNASSCPSFPVLPCVSSFNTGEDIVSAQIGDGAGTYLVSPQILKLIVPQNALVGTYVSAATIGVFTGP